MTAVSFTTKPGIFMMPGFCRLLCRAFVNSRRCEQQTSLLNQLTLIVGTGVFPEKAVRDAAHIAVATVHGVRIPTDLELQALGQCADFAPRRTDL